MRHKAPPAGYIVGPNGGPIRDEAAHRAFRRKMIASAERVVWDYPDIKPDWKYRSLSRLEAGRLFQAEEPTIVAEVHRIYQLYVDDFMECLRLHEQRYNRGCMPQVKIVNRWNAPHGVQHIAQMQFSSKMAEVLIDTTEEVALLHPDAVGNT